jgi:glyoxylate/hydroxypyruvate reductase A
MPDASRVVIVIASYLEPEHVERIRAVSPRLEVIYEPDLVPPARYPADHYNVITRPPDDEARWRNHLRRAEVLFDFDTTHYPDLASLVPSLRWLQATSAGIGQLVRRWDYARTMPGVVFTTSSGVHARPLADFCLLSMLAFVKQMPRMIDQQRRHQWERYATEELTGRTLGIVGVGRIGAEVARLAKAMDMIVIGTKRTVTGVNPASLHLDDLYPPSELAAMLARSEFLVLVTPHTDETEKLLGAAELAMLPRGAVVINIGRGALIDEPALIAALRSGQVGGASLDVFAKEPLPADSPLWDMPNVLVSPHSASTSLEENGRITALFCRNLRAYLDGEALENVLDVDRLY